MFNQTGFEGEVKFKFHTYDQTGRDVVIPIVAKDEDEALKKFNRIYGKDTIVDMIVMTRRYRIQTSAGRRGGRGGRLK